MTKNIKDIIKKCFCSYIYINNIKFNSSRKVKVVANL